MNEETKAKIRPFGNLLLLAFIIANALLVAGLETFAPGTGLLYAEGLREGLRAVPDPFYQLAAAGWVTWQASRGFEKVKGVAGPALSASDDPFDDLPGEYDEEYQP